MRPRTVLILAAIFGVLVVTVIVDRSRTRLEISTERVRVLSARPSEIDAIVVTRAENEVRLTREPIGWVLRRGESVWPADGRRVSAALRVLSSAQAEPVLASAATDDLDGSLRCIVSASGSDSVITIIDGVLSGERLALVDGTSVRVATELADMLEPRAVSGWIDASLLPGFGAEVFDLSLRRGSNAVALSRSGKRWGLSDPIVSPADPEKVGQVLGRLAALDVVHMSDAAVIGDILYSLQAKSAGTRWKADLDAQGRGVVSIETPQLLFTSVVELQEEGLAVFDADVSELVSRLTLDVPASDVAEIEVSPAGPAPSVRFRREGRGWSAEDYAVGILLDLLTARRAETSRIEAAPPDATGLRINRFGGLPVASLRVWRSDRGMTINDGSVSRLYLLDSDQLAAVTDLLSRSGG
ncbi:MAG: hypothetical protein AAF937_00740 [Planctomycetota bacterium]